MTWLPFACAAPRSPALAPSPVASSAMTDSARVMVPVPDAPVESSSVAAPVPSAECELYCEPPQMLPRAAPAPDYTQREVDDANAVLGSMRDDLLACYKKRLRIRPEAHGFITIDILIGDDGHVRNVDTTGGAILGDTTMGCIVHRIERGTFEPPHGGGTIHVRVPFSLRRVAPGEDP